MVFIFNLNIFNTLTLDIEATILFNTYKVFSADFEISNQANNRYENQNINKNNVDVRYLGLFFALQLFHYKAKSNIDARDKTPWMVNYFNCLIFHILILKLN